MAVIGPFSEFLVDEVMTFCHSCAECLTSVRQVIKDKDDKSSNQRDTPRRKKEKIALVGGDYLNLANTIDIFDGLKKSWTLSEDIGIEKINFASVVVGDWMFIIGGNSAIKIETSVEYIDLKSGQKHPLKPLNQARYKLSAVTLRRDSSTEVYAIGGKLSFFLKAGKIRESVERWNSKTGDWEFIAPLCIQWRNSWTYRADMIRGRFFHSSVAFKGKLFIGGGCNSWQRILISVEQYDPIANVWTAFTELPVPAESISLCCFQNKLLSMGGRVQWYDHQCKYVSEVWEYDETRMSWKASPGLSRDRAYAVTHVIPYDSIIWAPQQLSAGNSVHGLFSAWVIQRKINFFKIFFRK
ncbi:kelch-like protein 40 [Arctopsyche grandis]|uniref:kelch-like protein 40 n=1 Tax=Arctopsyche grandis TaxID=121162 RepID=UPI00406D9790